MAKFCTKCGKKLEDGQVCDCSKKEKVTEAKTKEAQDLSNMANQTMEIAKGLFTHPIDTIRKYGREEHFVLGLILIAINSLVLGLFVWLLVKELMSVTSGYGMLLGEMADFDFSSLGELKVPISVLFKAAMFGAVGFLSHAGMLYLFAGPVMKGKENAKQFFSLIGVCSVLTTISTLVACVLMYMSLQVTALVMALAAVLYFTYLYHGLVETTDINKNRLGYVYTISLAVATFVIFYILPKIMF